ncbi:hypothetical protein BS78_02G320200 [Paspalum vaginatum]|nr:hypothetical protein BS78_02G320200 [Paspalum vaginatum]
MEASGSGGNEPGGRPWTATSTWSPGPGGGAVEDAVSFETSDEDAEAGPAGVVLFRPPPDGDGDVPPCEVTVSFRGKYEIHRVYVRSTARVYELYHCTDKMGTSKDYLCTVRCGLAVKEPQPCGEESVSQWNDSALTSDKREHEAKSVSSGSSDEDSWVDVNIPESPVGNNTPETQERNAIQTCPENALAHYEATAEMTDVSPCVSLTIRLVSLQPKTSVHIEEIYIFADPVESTNDDSSTSPGNMGGSSLLAMLVPGLMQMSKSKKIKVDNSYFSDGLKAQLTQDPAVKESGTCKKVTQEAGPCNTNGSKPMPAGMEGRMGPTVGGAVSNEKSNQGEFQLKDPNSLPLPVQEIGSTQVPSVKDQQVLKTGHLANPLVNETFTPYNQIERKLDTLLSKVEKMELYFSKFEDSMMKPLGSIDARLQRLEEQFSSFSVDIQSLQGYSAVRSVPDGTPDTLNSQGGTHNDVRERTPASTTVRKPGLAVRAPDFSSDDSCAYNVTKDFISQPELTGGLFHDGPFSIVDSTLPFEKELKTYPGLVVKVPEFPDDDEDDDDEEGELEEEKEAEVSDHDDGHTRYDDTLSKSPADDSKRKKPLSINGALASALEALLTSTKGTSSKSAVCTASNLSAENINDSFSEMSTKDGSADQFLSTSGDADLVSAFTSSQETDATTLNSLAEEMLDSKVEINEQNDDRGPETVSFVASTESLDVPSQTDIAEYYIDDRIRADRQNYGPNLDTIPYALSAGPLDSPKPPTVFKAAADGVKVNENKPSISLAEFLAARNASSCKDGTSEVCCGEDGTEKLSFEKTSAGAGKNSKNISHLLVKKALEVATDEREFFSRAFSPDDSLSKQNAEHSWSNLSIMESFSGVSDKEPVLSANATSGYYVEDLEGIGDSPVATPISGVEEQKVCDYPYDFKDVMFGMTSTAKGTSKSSPSLEVLLAQSSDSEAHVSDLEDIENGAVIAPARFFSTFSSSDDDASAVDEPLIDVADLTTPSEPLFDVADLTNPSGTDDASVNEPSSDVVNLPNPSETYTSDVNDEPLVSVDDLPKPLEMFSGGSSAELPDSLI